MLVRLASLVPPLRRESTSVPSFRRSSVVKFSRVVRLFRIGPVWDLVADLTRELDDNGGS